MSHKMTLQEKLAAIRAGASAPAPASAAAQVQAAAPAASPPPAPPTPPTPSAPGSAPEPATASAPESASDQPVRKLSLKEKLAAVRAQAAPTATTTPTANAQESTPEPAAATTPTPATAPSATTASDQPARKLSVKEKLAAARAQAAPTAPTTSPVSEPESTSDLSTAPVKAPRAVKAQDPNSPAGLAQALREKAQAYEQFGPPVLEGQKNTTEPLAASSTSRWLSLKSTLIGALKKSVLVVGWIAFGAGMLGFAAMLIRFALG